jgi:hypothetical protein
VTDAQVVILCLLVVVAYIANLTFKFSKLELESKERLAVLSQEKEKEKES